MKNKFLFILLITFLIKSYSQEKKINFQVCFGPTLSIPKTSKLTNSSVDGFPEIKSSINIGVFVLPSINYSLNKKTSLDFGLGFYLDRFSIENKIGPSLSKGNRNISQLQIPVNFNFNFGKNNSYQFGLGGFASLPITAKEKVETTINFSQINPVDPNDPILYTDPVISSNDIKDSYNSVSFGTFIQLKKNISFSVNTKGFLVLKINQYLNSIKNNNYDSELNVYFEFKEEKEPTTINLGIGIEL